MTQVSSQPATVDTQAAAAAATHAEPLDHTLAGMLMGIYVYWAQRAEGKITSATDEVDAQIDVAKLRGELLSKITELNGLFDKPTTRIRDLPADKKARAIALTHEINELGVQLGYCQSLDANGNPTSPPVTVDPTTGTLFGNKGNRVTRPPTQAQLGAAASAADTQAWADLQKQAASTATDSGTQSLQRTIARSVNGLEVAGVDMVNDTASDKTKVVPITEDGGRWFASTAQVNPDGGPLVASWSLYPAALVANQDKLRKQGSKMTDSVNYVLGAYDKAYAKAYVTPNNGYIVNGADESTDGASFKAAEVLVQNGCAIDNQNINKAMTRASNLVQEKNSLESGANEVLQLAMRTNRTLLTGMG